MISEQELQEFRASGAFDEQWYLREYPDVAMSGLDPALHYLWLGKRLGRVWFAPGRTCASSSSDCRISARTARASAARQ